ncbi:S-layer homology domain-containing protein [Anaerotignum sp.]
MGKEHQKKVLAALMAASIAIPTPVFAASPTDFVDFPNNWATDSLSHAVSHGLLSGDNGRIRANDTLKRAEMAAILNRLAGAAKGASLTEYKDVPASAWYYEDMAKAVQMGTFTGGDGLLRPEAPITR